MSDAMSGPTDEHEAARTEAQRSDSGQDPREVELHNLRAERDALRDQLVRTVADGRNVQKRMRAMMEEERRYAAQPLVRELLPALDNFERTLEAVEHGASVENLIEGVRAIDRQIRRALESVGVARVAAVGHPFDPERHEALDVHPTDDHPEDTVTHELEAGYQMHDRVVRPARVRVAKRP